MAAKSSDSSTACYFCGELIANGNHRGHIEVCKKILIPCPYKCSSYIPRLGWPKHKHECPNRITKSMSGLHEQKQPDFGNGYSRDRKISELSNVSSASTIPFEIQDHINYLLYSVNAISGNMRYLKEASDDLKMKTSNLYQMNSATKSDVELLSQELSKEQSARLSMSSEFEHSARALKIEMAQNMGKMMETWMEQGRDIDVIRENYRKTDQALKDHDAKVIKFDFDIKAITQTASEALEKLEIQERNFEKLEREISQIKLDLEILEDLCSNSESCNSAGNLLWKITNLDSKIQKARESKAILKSPIFYSHQYGYKIRLLLYLNGLKRWKDRYALICIQVLKGQYDMILKWPSSIEGYVLLRDLQNLEKPNHFKKFISARRQSAEEDIEDPQESSSNYIFIPHATLMKSTYQKDDTIFLEVIIDQK